MKKYFNLFLFLVCVTYPVSFAEESKLHTPLISDEKDTKQVEPTFYNESENSEVYDFLAAEIAAKKIGMALSDIMMNC